MQEDGKESQALHRFRRVICSTVLRLVIGSRWEIYAEFLALLGHEADLAVDGREGLARFDPLVHQVVITDFLMPGLTGLEIAEAIRAGGRTTPIVMISGSAGPDETACRRRRGCAFAQAGLLRAVRGGSGGGCRACVMSAKRGIGRRPLARASDDALRRHDYALMAATTTH